MESNANDMRELRRHLSRLEVLRVAFNEQHANDELSPEDQQQLWKRFLSRMESLNENNLATALCAG